MSRVVAVVLLFNAIFHAAAFAEAVPVKIGPGTGITRGGEPYFVKG